MSISAEIWLVKLFIVRHFHFTNFIHHQFNRKSMSSPFFIVQRWATNWMKITLQLSLVDGDFFFLNNFQILIRNFLILKIKLFLLAWKKRTHTSVSKTFQRCSMVSSAKKFTTWALLSCSWFVYAETLASSTPDIQRGWQNTWFYGCQY